MSLIKALDPLLKHHPELKADIKLLTKNKSVLGANKLALVEFIFCLIKLSDDKLFQDPNNEKLIDYAESRIDIINNAFFPRKTTAPGKKKD